MNILNTITDVVKVFETNGSKPLLFTCSDYNEWVCKYDRDTTALFKELLAARFAERWKIKVPEINLIKVSKEHIPQNILSSRISLNLFDKLCFGSKYYKNTLDVNLTLIPTLKQNKSFVDKIKNKDDILKIALFDIWLSNEDRNDNNNNLLLKYDSDKNTFFYAIDHVCIFNSNFLERGNSQIDEYDTIINSDLFKLLFKRNQKLNLKINGLIENFYLCIKDCQSIVENILDETPNSWKIDSNEIKNKLHKHLFNQDWLKQCEANFRSLIQSLI